MKRTNLAVLISGRGSNLKAIIDATKDGYLDKVDLKVLIANKEALGLKYAKEASIPYHTVHRVVNGKKIPEEEHDKTVMEVLEKYNIDLIALAGYNQILQEEFVNRYKWRIMNIHPSLLPSFGGTLHGQKDALEYGVKVSGCTVHFIEEGVDTGPIIIQFAVPVKDDDNEESLSNRILEYEHLIYPKAIKMFSEGRLRLDGRKVVIKKDISVEKVTSYRFETDKIKIAMGAIGVSEEAFNTLLEKAETFILLINDITPREATIIKQEMLAIGGDCAVPKDTILNSTLVPTNVLVIGNKKQIKKIIKKLKVQPFDLSQVADKISEIIDGNGVKI